MSLGDSLSNTASEHLALAPTVLNYLFIYWYKYQVKSGGPT